MLLYFFYKRYISFIILFLFIALTVHAQKLNINKLETEKLIKKAKRKVLDYERWINTIGLKNNTKWFRDDIKTLIGLNCESDSIPTYNNLIVSNKKTVHIKNYLHLIKTSHPGGIKFTHTFYNQTDPCTIITPEFTYIYIKLTYIQKIKTENNYFYQNREKSDTLDFYVKFIVRQLKPLETDLEKIYKITKHKVTTCQEEQKAENKAVFDKSFTLAKVCKKNEINILKKYAKNVVIDYANILNAVNNEKINTKNILKNYFYSDSSSLYNDIIPTSDKVHFFTPKKYIQEIKKYWTKDGIKFNYQVLDDKITIVPGVGHMSATVPIKQAVKTQNFKLKHKNLKNRVNVTVLFPIDKDGNVILKRGSAKIHKIREKLYQYEEKILKANTYYLQAGIQLNTMNYFGDLNQYTKNIGANPRFTRPSIGIHLSKKIKKQWHIRLAYVWGTLRGDDFISAQPRDQVHRYRYIRNLHFKNNIHELSLTATYELFTPKSGKFLLRTYQKRTFFNAYLIAGIGLLRHNPKARAPLSLGGNWISLRKLGTEGQGAPGYRKKYSLWQPCIPIGLGIKIKLTPKIDLGLEMAGRLLFTDYIDDVSGNYPAMEDLSRLARVMSNRTLEPIAVITGESRQSDLDYLSSIISGKKVYVGKDGNIYKTFNGFGKRGEQRGDPTKNDFYIVTGIHISYILGK